jgi:hypothetical protein
LELWSLWLGKGWISRYACGFTPAFGRAECRFRGGFRREAEASLYLEATIKAKARATQRQQQKQGKSKGKNKRQRRNAGVSPLRHSQKA